MNITDIDVWLLACVVLSVCLDQHRPQLLSHWVCATGGTAVCWLAYQTCSICESRSNASNILAG